MTVLSIEAELRAAPERLVVCYRVTNLGGGPAWVLDDMVVRTPDDRLRRTPAAMIVVEAEEPGAVRLVRGLVEPEAMVAFVLVPGARRVEPGQTLVGEGAVPLPLLAYHPQDGSRPLRCAPARARVEIGVIDEEPALHEWPLDDGGRIQVPTIRGASQRQHLVRSTLLELPPPVD